MTATAKPAQYGAVSPNLAAMTPPSRAPAQLPPAVMNKVVLPTRPSMPGGVSRCCRELNRQPSRSATFSDATGPGQAHRMRLQGHGPAGPAAGDVIVAEVPGRMPETPDDDL